MGVLAVLFVGAAMIAAPVQAPAPGYDKAYGFALRCFVANGVAIPRPEDDPSGIVTRAARDKARKSYDTVYFMGGKLGYSNSKIAGDLDQAQALEMRLLMQSKSYSARVRSECVTLGLM